ncbi:hypothetical protein [Sinorhizobium sp. 7-81]|nr:hypothetical protein [Sinorhizobium sp. 7-81]
MQTATIEQMRRKVQELAASPAGAPSHPVVTQWLGFPWTSSADEAES